MAYGAWRGDKQFVVVDGVEGKKYDGICEPGVVFSPDSRRVAYWAVRGDKEFVVVDGVEGKEYTGFLKGSKLVFDSATHFHTLALRGDEILLLEIDIAEK